jgi:hypothetical protein
MFTSQEVGTVDETKEIDKIEKNYMELTETAYKTSKSDTN